MQCVAPCGTADDFTCLTEANFPNPSTTEWVKGTNKGLLGTERTANSGAKYMTFETLNNPANRKTWLDNAYPLLIKSTANPEKVIPNPPNLDNVDGNLHGAVNLSPFITELSTFQSNLNEEYCFYQKMYYAALSQFLNHYKDSTKSSGMTFQQEYQEKALTCNNKVNTLIAWMNYLAEKQIINLGDYQSQINKFDDEIKKSSDNLTAQAKILQDNSKSSQLYQEMVKYTNEKNQAHQNLLALYFTLNVVAIASLFVLARVL